MSEPHRIYGWQHGHLSIARHYGAVIINGKTYAIRYEIDGQPLEEVVPEALRLADILSAQAHRDDAADVDDFRYRAAAELRRQHAKIERLMEALEIIAGYRQCVDPLMGNLDVAEATLRREYV